MPLMKDQVFKRLSKKAKKGMRGWPLATIAYYGPDASRATKVVVSIFSAEGSEDPTEMLRLANRARRVRNKPEIAEEMLDIHGGPRRAVDRHEQWTHGLLASGRHRL